jgi:glycosyltransferase involved in cell wall biosynthesis
MGVETPPILYYMTEKSKLKILMCSEASFINSGFGVYTKELLSRLHKTGKYEIAEFASYGFVNDPRDKNIHWTYYANAVKDEDPRSQEYSSRGDNQFGRWRFEKVLLDFKPDIVFDIRDYWMTAYQRTSPLRKIYHWILMPTVDSSPQQEEWIDTFLDADAIFTYSDWAAKVLHNQSSGKINHINTASPGVDCDVFKPKNRQQIKESLGIPQDSIIIGSVMRNQKRKLFPELFETFRRVLDRLEKVNSPLAKNLFLYVHTSYPDMGWDIPELLKENRIANKVLFSYICKNCGTVGASKFQGPVKVCHKCLNKSSGTPTVTIGYSPEDLSNVYNLFDLYVQYAICEGFGMPQVEAGACGVPIATVNYSAMVDIVNKLEAYPVKVQTEFKELETKAIRVYPDNEDLANYIIDFISIPEPIRNQKRQRIHQLTHEQYNWDSVAKKWEEYFDKLDASGYRANWKQVSGILSNISIGETNPALNFDNLLGAINNNIKQSSMIGDQKVLELLNYADYGFVQNGPTNIQPYTIKNLYDYLNTYVNNNNQSQMAIQNNISFDEDFISYAHLKRNT